MLQLRIIVPAGQVEETVDYLLENVAVTNVVTLPGAARQPEGDLVICDVAREGTNEVLEALRERRLHEDGSIAVDALDLSLSRGAREAEEAAPGEGVDAVVWEDITERTADESVLSFTYVGFMILAVMLAAIGVLLDQPILIVGSMVVGPEFGPLAGLCVGLVQRRPRLAGRSALALLVGFSVAMAAGVVFTWLMTAAGLVDASMLLRPHPLTEFIWKPDALSWVVGFLAGVAGIMSLTSAKSGALVGVVISVTTVPAAANVAVALAYGVAAEAKGSALQLLINVVAIVVAGIMTLAVQRWWWSRRGMRLARKSEKKA